MKRVAILLSLIVPIMVFSQSWELGFGFQNYSMKGTRIVDLSTSSDLPVFEVRDVEDIYPIYGVVLGGYYPFNDWKVTQKTFGLTQRFNLGYSSGKNTNSAGIRGTYFYTMLSQTYLSFKSGVGSVTTKQYGKKKGGITGWGFGFGVNYGTGSTDYYKQKWNYGYLSPLFSVEFNLEIADLGIIRFLFYKSLARTYTFYRSYVGKIKSIGITDFGVTVSLVF